MLYEWIAGYFETTPSSGIVLSPLNVSLDKNNGTVNRSNNDVGLVVLRNTEEHQWRTNYHSMLTEVALFWPLFADWSFRVGVLENESV